MIRYKTSDGVVHVSLPTEFIYSYGTMYCGFNYDAVNGFGGVDFEVDVPVVHTKDAATCLRCVAASGVL